MTVRASRSISSIRSCAPVPLATICALITVPDGSTAIDDHSSSAIAPAEIEAGGNGASPSPGTTDHSGAKSTSPRNAMPTVLDRDGLRARVVRAEVAQLRRVQHAEGFRDLGVGRVGDDVVDGRAVRADALEQRQRRRGLPVGEVDRDGRGQEHVLLVAELGGGVGGVGRAADALEAGKQRGGLGHLVVGLRADGDRNEDQRGQGPAPQGGAGRTGTVHVDTVHGSSPVAPHPKRWAWLDDGRRDRRRSCRRVPCPVGIHALAGNAPVRAAGGPASGPSRSTAA